MDLLPHECIYCTKQFFELKLYRNHLKVHDNEKSGEVEKFECATCAKLFNRKADLKKHEVKN